MTNRFITAVYTIVTVCAKVLHAIVRPYINNLINDKGRAQNY